jgi:tetratricopeptide (TPR) repeat protein
MKSNSGKRERQFEAICPKCKSAIILDSDEVEKGVYTCPECSQENEFTGLDLKEIEVEANTENQPGSQKKMYIIAIIAAILIFAGYFAYVSDSVKFINKKEKADKHLKAGNDIFQAQINNPQPDPKVMQTALDEFKKALEFDNNSTDALMNKAVILAGMGNFNESMVDLDKVISLNQNIPDAYLYRALCRLQLNDIVNALPDFDKAIQLNPENLNAIFYRANAKYSLKDYQGAMDDMNLLIKVKPDIPNSYAFRGLCQINLGNQKDGCADLRKSKEMGLPEADTLLKQYCK